MLRDHWLFVRGLTFGWVGVWRSLVGSFAASQRQLSSDNFGEATVKFWPTRDGPVLRRPVRPIGQVLNRIMDLPAKRTAFTLRATPTPIKWGVLLMVSLAFIVPLEMMRLPAALLLGAMAAAILVAVFDGKLAVPHWPYVLAQGLIGCLVARSIGPAILATMVQQWPLFLAGVCSVLLVSTSLGVLMLLYVPVRAPTASRTRKSLGRP
jgi:Transition state regulatory protein AbrB